MTGTGQVQGIMLGSNKGGPKELLNISLLYVEVFLICGIILRSTSWGELALYCIRSCPKIMLNPYQGVVSLLVISRQEINQQVFEPA